MTKAFQTIAFDIVGIVFAGVAAYGLLTGHPSGMDETLALTVAAVYLGVRMPTTPLQP